MHQAALSFAVVLAVRAVPLGAVSAAGEEVRPGRSAGVALSPADLKWEPLPIPGYLQARLWGQLDGVHARFIKWPVHAGFPLHKHTNDLRIVVITGKYHYRVEGQPEKELGPGSYVMTPGGVPHVASCPDGCMFLEEASGKFDSIPVSGK